MPGQRTFFRSNWSIIFTKLSIVWLRRTFFARSASEDSFPPDTSVADLNPPGSGGAAIVVFDIVGERERETVCLCEIVLSRSRVK